MSYSFFALLSRLKLIERWALMRSVSPENLSDHTVQVAFIAHALALLGNRRLGKQYCAERVALLALYHDVTEILTGDMPTPVKYKTETLRSAYKAVERQAAARLCEGLPEDLREDFSAMLLPCGADEPLLPLIRAADKLSAIIHCIEERKAGNCEFLSAEKQNLRQLHALNCPEAELFVSDFLEDYHKNLDELVDF